MDVKIVQRSLNIKFNTFWKLCRKFQKCECLYRLLLHTHFLVRSMLLIFFVFVLCVVLNSCPEYSWKIARWTLNTNQSYINEFHQYTYIIISYVVLLIFTPELDTRKISKTDNLELTYYKTDFCHWFSGKMYRAAQSCRHRIPLLDMGRYHKMCTSRM